MKSHPLRNRIIAGLVVVLAPLVVLWVHQVPTTVTDQDKEAIEGFLSEEGLALANPNQRTYEQEVEFITQVQRAVIQKILFTKPIPFGQPREPQNVLSFGDGLCYDRSRLLEKIFLSKGFDVRHIAIYRVLDGKNKLTALLTRGGNSHSISEVKTKKGWVVVDSSFYWISFDENNMPKSMKDIEDDLGQAQIKWRKDFVEDFNGMYKAPFVYVYGLYSRHGKFYPPYNAIPDINWREMLFNLKVDGGLI